MISILIRRSNSSTQGDDTREEGHTSHTLGLRGQVNVDKQTSAGADDHEEQRGQPVQEHRRCSHLRSESLSSKLPATSLVIVRLPLVENKGEGYSLRTTSPQFFFYILDLKYSEKFGVTFRTHSFLLENWKRVLKNHYFWKKLENMYSLMVLAKYY